MYFCSSEHFYFHEFYIKLDAASSITSRKKIVCHQCKHQGRSVRRGLLKVNSWAKRVMFSYLRIATQIFVCVWDPFKKHFVHRFSVAEFRSSFLMGKNKITLQFSKWQSYLKKNMYSRLFLEFNFTKQKLEKIKNYTIFSTPRIINNSPSKNHNVFLCQFKLLIEEFYIKFHTTPGP